MSLRRYWSSAFLLVSFVLSGVLLVGCDSNGDGEPDETTFTVTIENVGSATPILKSGAFNTPTNESDPGPISAGNSYSFSFTAGPNEIPNSGMRLSFATMFIQSNDMYYAFEPAGLSLFENGQPIGLNSPQDVTSSVYLYDAGTEVDQRPGTGSNQAPRQSGVDTGADENGSVVQVTNMVTEDDSLENDGFSYPPTEDVIQVTVESEEDAALGGYRFTVTITNQGTTVNGAPIPLSPGSYAVHWAQTPDGSTVTFPGHMTGSEASAGIERIAEDGSPAGASGVPGNHVDDLASLTGVTVPLSPGAYAIHSSDVAFYEIGASASGGLEDIAEDGMPGAFVSALSATDGVRSAGAFNTPDGASEPGPLAPGNTYSFSVDAVPGDRLSFATMYIQSNDLFYAFAPEGLPLFDSNGNPISGDLTSDVMLYDAGTEGDQEPGVGLDQAPRQSDVDTGPSGEGSVSAVSGENDGFSYPSTSDIVRVTISPPSTQ